MTLGLPISPHLIQYQAEKYAEICYTTWSPIIQSSALGLQLWKRLFSDFADHQLIYEGPNNNWLGFANTMPIHYDGKLDALPDEGWDWLFLKGFEDKNQDLKPNYLGGLQIGVNPLYRSKGWSKKILEEAKKFYQTQGYRGFILPIRPTLKHLHPEVDMNTYLDWKKEGKIYDPWIRTHLQSGARILKVCPRAMTVEGSISDWEKWSGMKFPTSGKYAISGGLSLVDIDIDDDRGTYLEPNIWIVYE